MHLFALFFSNITQLTESTQTAAISVLLDACIKSKLHFLFFGDNEINNVLQCFRLIAFYIDQ